jgi:hypothetical protein
MHWIIQDNIYGEPRYPDLIQQIERQGGTYDIVKVVPFSHELVFLYDERHNDSSPRIGINKKIFVVGSVALSKIAHTRGWYPGAFTENMGYSHLLWWGTNNLLNPDCTTFLLRNAWEHMDSDTPDFFMRPVKDDKAFSGKRFSAGEVLTWVSDLHNAENDGIELLNTQVLKSSLKHILREYRFFIVDGKIATESRYRLGGRVSYNENVDPEAVEFVESMLYRWNPAPAYALDVALTDSGYRIIETNSINSAGFYHADMSKYVSALTRLVDNM